VSIGEKIPERTTHARPAYGFMRTARSSVDEWTGALFTLAAERENLLQSAYHELLEPSDAPTAAPPAAPPEPTPYDPRSESFEEWLARADTVLDPFYPSFHARAELTWDTIDDWLQQASMPHDPLGLEPHEVDALRVLLAFAEARGFPPLTIPAFGYTIRAGQAGWLNALPDIAGTPAVALATRLLQSLDAAGEPDAPTPTFTNGNAGLTPLQFTLIQEV
jgi:hypothetical protein